MSQQLVASMPGDVEIGGSWIVEWDAVDPTTGATVAGVKVSLANVVGHDLASAVAAATEALGPFMLVPGPNA